MNYNETSGQKPLRFQQAPAALTAIERVISVCNQAITNVCLAISAAGVLLALAGIIYGVVLRYALGTPVGWIDDSVGFLLVGIVMLTSASTLRKGRHINVDMFTTNLGEKGKRWADIWASLSVAVFSFFLIINGWETVSVSRDLGMMTSGNVEIPIYWLQLFMPLGGLLMLLVSIETLLKLALGYPMPRAEGHHVEEE